MPQMSPIYWLIMMMYFILMLIILIMSFFFNLSTMNSSFVKINDSMNLMWWEIYFHHLIPQLEFFLLID